MRVLFIHNSFSGQFGPRAQYLEDRGHKVVFLTSNQNVEYRGFEVRSFWSGARGKKINIYSQAFHESVDTAHSAASEMMRLKQEGFVPDVVVSHAGNGVGFFVKDVWLETRHLVYLEWYYNVPGVDIEFLYGEQDPCQRDLINRLQNASILLELASADRLISPTNWQKEQFPKHIRDSIDVLYDGLEVTDAEFSEESLAQVLGELKIPAGVQYITYVARGFERYRGFGEFMQAVELLQIEHPNLHVIVVGLDKVFYGKELEDGRSYKAAAMQDLDLDLSRIHFVGWLGRPEYKLVLQGASAHVYLTVPFVLSWSFVEAMSLGCSIVATRVPPVLEFVRDGEEGLLVDFFCRQDIAASVSRLVRDEALRSEVGSAAKLATNDTQNKLACFKRFEMYLQNLCDGADR